MPRSLLERLEKESRLRRRSKSALVREFVQQGLNGNVPSTKPSLYDLTRDIIEAAGKKKRVPADFATNPKYMEGFGQ